MATDLKSFIDNEFIPRLFENLDTAFPDMKFRQYRGDWVSPLKLDGSPSTKGAKTKSVVKQRSPFVIMENGGENMEIIKWAMSHEGFATAYEAVKAIGARIGLTPPQCNNNDFSQYRERLEAYASAAEEMQRALFSEEAAPILAYLTEQRGYSIEEIKHMGLGFINKTIADKYRNKFYLPNGVEAFNQLAIMYISGGKIEGFKFRATHPKAFAKYVNSKFSKSNYLFGLSAIPMSGTAKKDRLVILVDGELKALYMGVKGFNNVVAAAGSDSGIISDEQLKQARQKGVEHIVIIADNESTETERAKEVQKIENTLQMINRVGLSGYVVYLPQEDTTRKEDVEDFLRRYGAEELNKYIKNPQSGAEFRANNLVDRYISLYGSNQLTAIQTNDFYRDLFVLMNEYNGTNIAFIESALKERFGESAPVWLDVMERGAKSIVEIQQQQKKEVEAKKLSADIADAVARGDYNAALTIASQAQTILNTNKAAQFSEMFKPRKWSDTTIKLSESKIGIDTLYKFKRGKETDLLILPNGALSIIAAPTNHGKSTFLQNLALQAAYDPKQEGAIMYLTFEEDAESVQVQFLSKVIGKAISRDNKRSIKNYYLGNKQYITDPEAFKRGEERMAQLIDSGKLWINGTDAPNGLTIDVLTNLLGVITQATTELPNGVAAVFIDYIQLVQPDERTKNRAEDLKIICTELKNLAVRLGLPIVLAAQFSREGSKSPYELEAESLGEGGDIERASTVIVGLWNTSKQPRQNSRFSLPNKIWENEDNSHNFKITFDANNPKIYARLLKSRGEPTGGEALLNCDLNVGTIEPNITRQEIEQLRAADIPQSTQSELFNSTEGNIILPF